MIFNCFLSLKLGGDREKSTKENYLQILYQFFAVNPYIASKAIQTNFQNNSNGVIQTNFD